MNNRDIKLHRY